MSSDLITSTMKSEAGAPPACLGGSGVPISALASAAEGRSADGRAGSGAVDAAFVCAGATALAALATATPVRKLRRLTPSSARLRAIDASSLRPQHFAARLLLARNLVEPRRS